VKEFKRNYSPNNNTYLSGVYTMSHWNVWRISTLGGKQLQSVQIILFTHTHTHTRLFQWCWFVFLILEFNFLSSWFKSNFLTLSPRGPPRVFCVRPSGRTTRCSSGQLFYFHFTLRPPHPLVTFLQPYLYEKDLTCNVFSSPVFTQLWSPGICNCIWKKKTPQSIFSFTKAAPVISCFR